MIKLQIECKLNSTGDLNTLSDFQGRRHLFQLNFIMTLYLSTNTHKMF